MAHGYAFKSKFFSDNPTPNSLFTRKNFAIGGGFRPDGRRYYDGPVPEKFILSSGDILVVLTDLSKNGDLLGFPASVPNDGLTYLHNQRVGKLIVSAKDRADERFLYYVFCSPTYRQHVLATATQTTVRDTAPSRLEAFEFALPPLDEQRRIAGVLGALDRKIDHNALLSGKLAEQARVCFEYSKSRWRTRSTLAEIATSVREPASQEDGLTRPYIGLDNMPKASPVITDWLVGDAAPKGQALRFSQGDILFGKLRPYFKKVGVAPIDGRCSSEILVLRPVSPTLWSTVLGYATSDDFIAHCVAVSKGTKMPRSEWVDASSFEITVPSHEEAKILDDQVAAIYRLVLALGRESRHLAKIRTTLLPKLVAGEVRTTEYVFPAQVDRVP